ncbi:putative PPR repeat family protein [Lyophyllum shimeji]|uniref:PPR repeat family protein n=1 Tax=Lyophyllum shimeji TaxID=47721 RepID=A0A9P3UHE1_LYOSH|nr:putative PPR repeat family protein [Lyophyllum shimeji]
MLRRFPSNAQLNRLHFSCCCALRNYATSSTTTSRVASDAVDNLPRYLTPKSAIPNRTPQKQDEEPVSPKKVFRSRHLDASKEQASKSTIRLLEPHVLSARLKKLCDANKIDEAVSMLKNSPRDAQNTPVWNTLIWESMKAKRFNLAYQLYTDMKRRGFSPTARTFQTMFTGLSKIEDWSTHTKQLKNAHSIYDAFQRYMKSVRQHDPESAELTSNPLANYVKILGYNGLYQEIFDVYYALPSEGPLSPNEFVYTAMFEALASTPSVEGLTVPHYQHAANAKLLWTLMQKALRKIPAFTVDTHLVTSAIAALSRGHTPEFELAFTIVRDYYGLCAPGDPPSKGSLPLSQQSLDVILKLCNISKKYALCGDFLQQVKRRPDDRGGVNLLDHGHLNEVLKARIAAPDKGTAYACLETLEWMLRQEIVGRNGSKIRPNTVTYNLVLTACWRDGDWRSAARVFDLMTGYHSHDFMDGAVSPQPRRDARSVGRNLDPPPETLSSLLRTALTSRDRANVRQCLRILDYLQVDQLLAMDNGDPNRGARAKAYFIKKLASAIVEAVQFVQGASSKPSREMGRWKRLADLAVLNEQRTSAQRSDFIPSAAAKRPREGKAIV